MSVLAIDTLTALSSHSVRRVAKHCDQT